MKTLGGLAINIIFLIMFYIDTFFVRINIGYYHNGRLI